MGSLVEDIEMYGRAVDNGTLTFQQAVLDMVTAQEGGLTSHGAADLLRNWKTARSKYEKVRTAAEKGLMVCRVDLADRDFALENGITPARFQEAWGAEMPVVRQLKAVQLVQQAVAKALWHYTAAPIAKPYYVRGCIPDPTEARVTVALWTGPAARVKRNLFLHIPLVHDEMPVSATQVTIALMRLGRGAHLLGSTGRWFDGNRVFDGSSLIASGSSRPVPDEIYEGSWGFYFERPGQLTRF
ncbi:hypothetical protein AB0C52_23990 [Streptomyces sp. NPDC048717]|uniref:hypothetical protein n=1 Tax=Streptomyces sp. NPDC048717 TaxID=3154928 RepID=UPI0034347B3F